MSKVIQFTISPNSEKILESFSKKYGTSKSNVVNRALEFLAGAYHKKIIISYELTDHEFKEQEVEKKSTQSRDEVSDEEWAQIQKDIDEHYEKYHKGK